MDPIDITTPRERIYQQFENQPGPCPRCGSPLQVSAQTYLVATRRGERITDSFFLSGDIGWFCAKCPTVVINPDRVSDMMGTSLPHWDVGSEFAVAGIMNLDAIPPEQRHLPLSEVEPLPLVPFRQILGESSAPPRRKARPRPASARQKPSGKRKRRRKR